MVFGHWSLLYCGVTRDRAGLSRSDRALSSRLRGTDISAALCRFVKEADGRYVGTPEGRRCYIEHAGPIHGR